MYKHVIKYRYITSNGSISSVQRLEIIIPNRIYYDGPGMWKEKCKNFICNQTGISVTRIIADEGLFCLEENGGVLVSDEPQKSSNQEIGNKEENNYEVKSPGEINCDYCGYLFPVNKCYSVYLGNPETYRSYVFCDKSCEIKYQEREKLIRVSEDGEISTTEYESRFSPPLLVAIDWQARNESIAKHKLKLKNFEEEINKNPNNPETYFARATCNIKLTGVNGNGQTAIILGRLVDNFDNCIKDINLAIGLNPNEIKYYEYKACLLQENKKYDDAIIEFSRLISLNPNNALYYMHRLCCYIGKEKYYSAVRDSQKALDIDFSLSSKIEFLLDNRKKQIELFERALKNKYSKDSWTPLYYILDKDRKESKNAPIVPITSNGKASSIEKQHSEWNNMSYGKIILYSSIVLIVIAVVFFLSPKSKTEECEKINKKLLAIELSLIKAIKNNDKQEAEVLINQLVHPYHEPWEDETMFDMWKGYPFYDEYWQKKKEYYLNQVNELKSTHKNKKTKRK